MIDSHMLREMLYKNQSKAITEVEFLNADYSPAPEKEKSFVIARVGFSDGQKFELNQTTYKMLREYRLKLDFKK